MKDNGIKNFVILDSGMTELIRPALYDAHHEILPISPKNFSTDIYDFVGQFVKQETFLLKTEKA